jgi:hypothetical protein
MFGNTVSVRLDTLSFTAPAVSSESVGNLDVPVNGVAVGDSLLPQVVLVGESGPPMLLEGVCGTAGTLTLALTNFTATGYGGGDPVTVSATLIKHTGSV